MEAIGTNRLSYWPDSDSRMSLYTNGVCLRSNRDRTHNRCNVRPMDIVAVREAKICFNAQPGLVDGCGPIKSVLECVHTGAFPMRLIHGINARGMQIKRCSSEREARNATKSGSRNGREENEKERERNAYCARHKRRLKKNTKFARVMCTPLLHVYIKNVYVSACFLSQKA